MRLPPLPTNDPAALARAWNNRFPFDYWWRQKYNVPFGSPQHKAMSLWDIAVEYEQHRWIEELKAQAAERAQQAKLPAPTSLFKTLGTVDYTTSTELDDDFAHLMANLDADYSPVTPTDHPPAAPDEQEPAADFEE